MAPRSKQKNRARLSLNLASVRTKSDIPFLGFTTSNRKDNQEKRLAGEVNNMTSLTALLSKWPLISREEEIIFVWSGLMLVLLAILYQVQSASPKQFQIRKTNSKP